MDEAAADLRSMLVSQLGLSQDPSRVLGTILGYRVVRSFFRSQGEQGGRFWQKMLYVSRAADAFRHLYGGSSCVQTYVASIVAEAHVTLANGGVASEVGGSGMNPHADDFI